VDLREIIAMIRISGDLSLTETSQTRCSLGIRLEFYTDLLATGRTFDLGEQRPAVLRENLALIATRVPNGIVTAEIARKQIDGLWLWVIVQPSISV
jgi:hypothetical protein